MSKESKLWLIVFLVGAVLLLARGFMSEHGMGKVYVNDVSREFAQVDLDGDGEMEWKDTAKEDIDIQSVADENIIRWTEEKASTFGAYQSQAEGGDIRFSLSGTIGVWMAALFTLFVLSFLIADNPFYKISEAVFIGVSAAYWMVVGFWGTMVPNLLAKISPDMIRGWSMPGLGAEEQVEWAYLVPLVLGVMLVWRLAPVGAWISRWPMAFFIGTFCGLRLITFIHADFLTQIRNSIEPVVVMNDAGSFEFWDSMKNFIMIVGVLSGIVYFFFSFEHKGMVGKTAKLGIWFLMVTFGAAFGYTVMGRIALLAIRLEFLFDDWLWLVDPTDKRVVADAVSLILPGMGGWGF